MTRSRICWILIAIAVIVILLIHFWPEKRTYSESRAVAESRRIWGDVCGRSLDPTIRVVNLPGDQRGEATTEFIDLPTGRAYSKCEIKLDPTVASRRGPRACAVLVHEWGHLDGKGHSKNPRSVMYPVISDRNIPPGCQR